MTTTMMMLRLVYLTRVLILHYHCMPTRTKAPHCSRQNIFQQSLWYIGTLVFLLWAHFFWRLDEKSVEEMPQALLRAAVKKKRKPLRKELAPTSTTYAAR